jgi:hypothetical protein
VAITIDDSVYPFVLQGFPSGPKSDPALRDGTLHVVVAVGDERFTAAERKIIAECMAMTATEEEARVVGAFAVIENSVARGVLTALRWLAPHAIPVVCAATPEEAIDLARTRLEVAAVDVPPDVVLRARIAARKLHTILVQRTGAPAV